MIIYGAYGSNLNREQMKKRCPLSKPITSLYLPNWHLVFKGVADIEKKKNSGIYLGLYSITPQCEKALDYYEDFPDLYKKIYVDKRILGKDMRIMIYLMSKQYKYSVPTIRYFNTINKGYDVWKLKKDFLYNSAFHSIKNNNKNEGYLSKNWKEKTYIDNLYIKNIKDKSF